MHFLVLVRIRTDPTFEHGLARRHSRLYSCTYRHPNVVSMPDRVLTLAAHPFLAPSRCVVARSSQDVRPSRASQIGSLQGNVCVREKHSLDSASTGEAPPTPARPHISCAKHKLRERTPVSTTSWLPDVPFLYGRWHAVMRTRDSRVAVGATARAGGIVELTPVCAARFCAVAR